jgi:1-phosphofructokinase family hexose kinase
MLLSVTLNPCIDHAVFLDALHLGDTNRIQRVERDAGGKGLNVSRIYAALGGSTAATGFLGGLPASFIRDVLSAERVQDFFVSIHGYSRTNISIEDSSGNPPTTLNEKGPFISPQEAEALKNVIQIHAEGCTWTTFGGSTPQGLPPDYYSQLFSCVKNKYVLDADGSMLEEGIRHQPHFVKPNATEASKLLGVSINSNAEAVSACKLLYHRIGGGDRIAVISRGKDGAVVCGPNETVFLGKSPQITPVSTVGSGDSLIGGMLWALDAGKTLSEALAWGLASGAATALTDGTRIGSSELIRELFPLAKVDLIQ